MDPFQQVATWDETTARRWATGLDQRAADPQQVALRAGIVAAAALRPGQVAVEIGCGTGPLLAGLADAVGPTGRVIGVEPQPTLARLAARRLGERAAVCLGTGDALPVRSRVADVAVAQTVLLHVPRAALPGTLAEMVRVVRPGGRVISVDQDMDGWLVDHPDRDMTTRLLRQNTIHRYGEGWAGRRMPALFRAAGLGTSRWSRRPTSTPCRTPTCTTTCCGCWPSRSRPAWSPNPRPTAGATSSRPRTASSRPSPTTAHRHRPRLVPRPLIRGRGRPATSGSARRSWS